MRYSLGSNKNSHLKALLYLDSKNENHEQKWIWIYNCFYMKIINVHEHHAYDKNNAEYVNAGTFPQ